MSQSLNSHSAGGGLLLEASFLIWHRTKSWKKNIFLQVWHEECSEQTVLQQHYPLTTIGYFGVRNSDLVSATTPLWNLRCPLSTVSLAVKREKEFPRPGKCLEIFK